MVKKLVKTGEEIHNKIQDLYQNRFSTVTYYKEMQYLILPDGLDALEEMLRQEIKKHIDERISTVDDDGIIHSVFARFKKEIL